jgi:lipopolysaccharide/colanic/teichoic acid biosynthesis glycosyltransferase
MDATLLPTEKIINTYKRYSLPVHETEAAAIKLQFFYIGTQSRYTGKLKDFFEFGYTSVSVESAISTLKRLLRKKDAVTIPDMIIAEGTLGTEKLVELHRFLSTDKIFADIPFIIDGSGLSRTELAAFKRYAFIDELLFLNEFAMPELLQKVNFLKKVKQQWVHQPASCAAVEASFPVFPSIRSFLKRGLDVLFSLSMLLVLGPVMLLIALAVKLESGGPVLHISKRTGRGYRIFDLYKFSTLLPGADEKITRIGWFLHKTGLDELPQLLNVLLGDMSLVGNRALPLHEAARLTTDECAKRFMNPAGITGLWQAEKTEKNILSVAEAAKEGDFAEKTDLLYDIWLMANKPPAIIHKTNA